MYEKKYTMKKPQYLLYESGVPKMKGTSVEIGECLNVKPAYISYMVRERKSYHGIYTVELIGFVDAPFNPANTKHQPSNYEKYLQLLRDGIKYKKLIGIYRPGDKVVVRGMNGEVIYADDDIFTVSYEIPSGHLCESFCWHDLVEKERRRDGYEWLCGTYQGERLERREK